MTLGFGGLDFPSDGVAGIRKIHQEKVSISIPSATPYMKKSLGYHEAVEERYFNGNLTKEAFNLYKIISQEEGIDTRALRAKAD